MSKTRIDGLDDWETWISGIPAEVQQAVEEGLEQGGYEIERLAKSKVPVDTGRLKGSIMTDTSNSGGSFTVEVGTDVEYSPHVEYGTINQGAQPFLNPSFDQMAPKIIERINNIVNKELS